MKNILVVILMFFSSFTFSQDGEALALLKKANNHVYEGNELVEDDFTAAEMEYRKALSKQSNNVAGVYNLGNSYYKNGSYQEAIYRYQQAVKSAETKQEKHKAYNNMGNALMQTKDYKLAVEAYKNALRNNPVDEETRYNLAIAKKMLKEQEDKNKDKDKEDKEKKEENKEENKDQSDNKENKDSDNKEENKDGKDKENKENQENKDNEGKNEEDKKPEDKNKNDKGSQGDKNNKKQQKPKPQPQQGQLSPQQIKSLLDAMNNQEKKVQEKVNAEKQKGIIIKTEKDW